MPAELRIFVSSPGDVGRERELTSHVIKRLKGEYRRRVTLTPYFWEYEPMRATTDYQGNIPDPATFDIVICILWARLGSRLNENYQRPDGSTYTSGTEYELETAIESRKLRGAPEIYVYRNLQPPTLPLEPKEIREEKIRQYDALQNFFSAGSSMSMARFAWPGTPTTVSRTSRRNSTLTCEESSKKTRLQLQERPQKVVSMDDEARPVCAVGIHHP